MVLGYVITTLLLVLILLAVAYIVSLMARDVWRLWRSHRVR